MKKISLSIIPTYWCKTNCKYCYLGDLRKDQTTLDLQCLDNKLHQLVENDYVIDSISVYGGEISLLDEQYLIQIVKIIRSHVSNQVTIGFCTSGYNRSIFELAEYLKVRVTIPLNQERPDYKKNLQLIKQHNCSLGVVVLPSIINTPVDQLVEFDTLDQWKQYCKKERLQRLIKCNACPYYDKCKAEHLVVMGEEYCSGMRKLITSGCLG